MTYVVLEDCIKCKHTDCVDVCPVDCFHEGENMLVIDPEECIDCSLCEPECPVEAIVDAADLEDEEWLEINKKFAAIWPVITEQKDAPNDAERWAGVPNKLEHLSTTPGTGD